MLRHEEDTKDVTQEVFVKIHRSSKLSISRIKTWMARIATNHAIDYKRKKLEKTKNSPYVKKLRKI
ncbi:sigma factor [Bacillus pacificus]